MKKSNIHGWKDVFSFTLIQTLKSKAYIISNIIFLLSALIALPIVTLITSGGSETEEGVSPITKVYVYNETSLSGLDFSSLKENEVFSATTFETLQEDYNAVADRIEESETKSVILTITENQGMYNLSFEKAVSGSLKESNVLQLGNAVAEQFKNLRIENLGISKDQLAIIQAPVTTAVTKTDANGEIIVKEDTSITGSEYWFIYGILFFVLLVNSIASSQVATSIVTEKSTRVIEYLLTSIKPLALMVGKVLAMLVAVLIQMVSLVFVIFISNMITAKLSIGTGKSLLATYLPTDIFTNLNPINIIFCIILVMLGFIFYATLASLAGATVSKLEEMGEGLMVFTFTNLIGAYIGLGAAAALVGAGDSPYVTFSFLFPLSSPFILPGAIMIGKANLLIILSAIVLQILLIILLFKFVAKVFETLILHNGDTIKLKELIKISKTV